MIHDATKSPPTSVGGLDAFIEQFNAKLDCSAVKRPYLIGYSSASKTVVLWRPGCGQWACPACGRRNAMSWVHKIAYGSHIYMLTGESWAFATLTARRDRRGFNPSLSDFQKGWPKLLLRIKRYISPLPFHYAMIPERHQDGTVHMHALWSERFDAKPRKKANGETIWRSKDLADMLAACGLGWSHDCQPIDDSTGAALYAAKYIGKQAGDEAWPKGLRHVRTSHKWPEHDDHTGNTTPLEWSRVRVSDLDAVLTMLLLRGYHLSGYGGGK